MGFIIKAKRNVAMAIAPVHKYQLGNPSLYKTKTSDKNIIALPASGCINIKIIGKPIIAKAMYWKFFLAKFTCASLKYLDINKATAVLTNSEGWKPNPPN